MKSFSVLPNKSIYQLIIMLGIGSLTGCIEEQYELRLRNLEQQVSTLAEDNRKLQLVAEEDAGRYAKFTDSIRAQTKIESDQLKVSLNSRFDDSNHQLDASKTAIIQAVQKANAVMLKNFDDRIDSFDVVIGTLLLRLEELEKRVSTPKNRQ